MACWLSGLAGCGLCSPAGARLPGLAALFVSPEGTQPSFLSGPQDAHFSDRTTKNKSAKGLCGYSDKLQQRALLQPSLCPLRLTKNFELI